MLQKILQIVNQAKVSANKVTQQLKSEKMHINQMNNAKDPTKPTFDHLSNFKEYSNILKDVYVSDPFKKLKGFAKKEKELYINQLQKTFPKETLQQYNLKLQSSLNKLKNNAFWKTSSENQSSYKKQQTNYSSTNYTNQYKQQQQNQTQSKQDRWTYQFWNKYTNKFQQDASDLNNQYSQNFDEQKQKFSKFKDAQKASFAFIYKNVLQKAKIIGQVSFKYILMGLFVLGIAYSIPKSISTYFATKATVTAQLQFENLLKENETLKMNLKQAEEQLQTLQQQTARGTKIV
ncbi:unnamed protein product (macronuclear) [Paramecium tetraurelia]|uniref:Transmembrane protein n=1 Tax=Paramecium tetraurelia TaxID=5888 RepID=A0BLM8_PARTE|nr:uncharacterized protein GSPATT00030078001 [Paramecium tetraurelia]CAK59445.1 unnamed protein product [Paramecium tetraurelia]|eukprot:XP_001426843.1 hypothetical protein (macronuclear) [Paramecium tetraurelia strain d4-2]